MTLVLSENQYFTFCEEDIKEYELTLEMNKNLNEIVKQANIDRKNREQLLISKRIQIFENYF